MKCLNFSLKKIRLALLLFLIFTSFLHANSYQDFEAFHSLLTQEEIAFKLQHYLQKDEEISEHFLLTTKAFYLYASKEAKIQHHPEFTLLLSSLSKPCLSSRLPSSLYGLRIAIDPGHVGGDYAHLEQRCFSLLHDQPDGTRETLSFKEGALTLLTALRLKQWLEAEGALVLLTKEREGQAVYP